MHYKPLDDKRKAQIDILLDLGDYLCTKVESVIKNLYNAVITLVFIILCYNEKRDFCKTKDS
jgi:hypothetical protein